MTYKPTKEEAAKIRDAARIISEEILWGQTDEGEPFWNNVYNKLVNIAKRTEHDCCPCVKKGKI